MITQEDLKILSAPFDENTVSVKVQSYSRDRTKAMLVLYLAHVDVYTRLEQVDPAWSSEVVHQEFIVTDAQKGSGYFSVRVKLSLKGSYRENSGEGDDPKSATSDAMKRAAMLFGVGRYLYDSEQVWIPFNEAQDKFKVYSIAEYRAASRRSKSPTGQAAAPKTPLAANPAPPVAPKAPVAPMAKAPPTRASLGAQIMAHAKTHGVTEQELSEWAQSLCNKASLKDLALVEMEMLLSDMKRDAAAKPVLLPWDLVQKADQGADPHL